MCVCGVLVSVVQQGKEEVTEEGGRRRRSCVGVSARRIKLKLKHEELIKKERLRLLILFIDERGWILKW